MEISGAEIIVNTLIDQGVDTIFGYPGGAVLNIYDALYDYEDEIRHIMTSHEQGAAHAADGYARSTGKTGVVLATSGPGATNLVTGIATAFMDSIPMVCLTGNVAQPLIGKDSFQEIYITGITMPITKHNFVVRDVSELANVIREAFRIANTGRKGPVLIDIPKDVTAAKWTYEKRDPVSVKPKPFTDRAAIRTVADVINEAKRPVIYAGGGVTSGNAHMALRALIQKASIPACNTIMGIGILGCEDELSMGMVGMHGRVSTNYAIENADLVLAIGVRFSDRVALNTGHYAPHAKIVHIDIDASEIGKNVAVDYDLVGDVQSILQSLLPHIEAQERRPWVAQINTWRELDYKPADDDNSIRPHQVVRTIAEIAGEQAIIVTDVGQHQMWAAQYCGRTEPRSFLTSGGLGTMGYGYGAAIGAKVANPDRPVVLITGDGSFHMNMNECPTAVSCGLNLITVVMNNKALGMPRQWQHYLYNDRYACSDFIRATDYVKLAEAFGAEGYRCTNIGDFRAAFETASKSAKPVIIECVIDPNEQVLPMIPAGGTIEDLILE
ncbi:MAG: biosynthetic-type acetolactate synthase large subunit [Eubacteriales bacterium]|nr:biosynthetic-type acetolactate synthase large subunit [Eubacteriales bacterium]